MKKKQLHKSNRLVTMLLLVIAILMPYGGAWAQTPSRPSSGDGKVDNPFLISTAAELAWFRDYVNNESQYVSATLTEDIDLSEFCHAADAATNTEELSWVPIGNGRMYCGTFDGNGKTIRNLYINSTIMYKGFFGYANSGSIKNITFDNAKVKNTHYNGTGILTGAFEKCTIENIKTLANCSVEGTYNTGGIAGTGTGNISNCENRAMVNGTNNVGGIVGNSSDNTISSCANYGAVTGTEHAVGGMVGFFISGTIQNCANYGDISGADYVGNQIGYASICNLNNVLGIGNVTATTSQSGLLAGVILDSSSTAAGILAYNSSAKLTINGIEQTGDAVKAIGISSLSSTRRIKAFSAEQLKSGFVAFILQGNASESAKWGQKLNTDDYPLLNSADKVYSDCPVTMKCSGELEGTGTFTNTKPAQEGTFTMQHGNSIIHHESVDVTCTVDGTIEYWECDVCNETYLDEKLTQPVGNIIKEAATGHNYDENDKCTKCQKEIQFVKLGNNNITIEKVFGTKKKISGYNLYKFTAPEEGALVVTADSHGEDTYGALWDSRTAKYLIKENSGNGDGDDFKITYEVTKGTTYYIGAREYDGDAIVGEVTLNVKMIGNQPPAGVTGNGTEAEPFILKTADHLAWFRDYVNVGKTSACAKIADDVEEIDMSTVCHEADAEKQVAELSWTPIGSKKYQGTFDGNGKTIRNLFISSTSNEIGFFGCAADCRIKNITFDNAKVKGNDNCSTGILAGYAGSCVIENIKTTENCSVEGKEETGGIAGRANGNISNCENHAIVNGSYYVGGIVGICFDSENSITSCANYGAITGTDQFVGGIIGYFGEGSLQNSANYGNITGDARVGNLIGYANICNINNVLGIGNITANHANCNGLLAGVIWDSSSTASGILAYNSSAKMTIDGTELTGDAVVAIGSGSLTYLDGKNEADVVKAFTPEQLKSGEVAYLLNGSKSEGKLAWYQQLGSDAYPVLKAAEGNTVYNGSFRYCDNTTCSYSNSTSEDVLVHQMSATLTSPEHDADEHIYHMGCRNEGCTLHKYVADKAGNIEVTKEANNKFVATEDLTLVDGEDFKDYEAFTSKTISYSRNIPEGAAWGTLCLPFAIDQSKVTECKFYSLTGIDADKECITLESYEEGIIPAGTPVLFKMKEGKTSLSLSASNAEIITAPKAGTNTDVNLVGSFTKIGGKDNQGLAENDYIIGKNKFWLVSELDGDNRVGIKPMRAYIHPTNVSQARATMLSIGKGDGTTAIDNLNAISNDANAEYYDVNGRRTNGLQKGLNIVKRGSKTYKIMVK
ncbi:hypothetical protein [Segatella copri]|uniref:hypothetical protein n=1 Tax=Segatella copri TaxID=165179 RepID=UPI00294A9B8F|nr:hypothetical protein [Segatella copri]WOF88003.1 hypothetical protein RJT05_01245 [Segatella copri]WOF94167.1 hypothetical protein RJT10_01510 [Segatella copri]